MLPAQQTSERSHIELRFQLMSFNIKPSCADAVKERLHRRKGDGGPWMGSRNDIGGSCLASPGSGMVRQAGLGAQDAE